MSDVVTIGAGLSLAFGATGQTTTYGTPLGKITKFQLAKPTVQVVKVETFDATLVNGLPVSDSIPGWIEPGTYEVTLLSVASLGTTLAGLFGVQKAWKCVKPDASGYKAEGFIVELGEETPLKELIETSFKIQINKGMATFAAVES